MKKQEIEEVHDPRVRAMWLAAVPPSVAATRAQREQAQKLATECTAAVVAEFLYNATVDGELGARGWEEVVELLAWLRIGVLVVLQPDAIARGVIEYQRRIADLQAIGVRLVLGVTSAALETAQSGECWEVAA